MRIQFLAGLVGFYSLLALSESAQAINLTSQGNPAALESAILEYDFINAEKGDKKEKWYLSIDKPRLLPSGGTPDFINTLKNTYSTDGPNKWTFSAAPTNLAGDLNIIQYSGCVKGQPCESSVQQDPLGLKITVGGIFIADYNLAPGDPFSSPIANDASIKWIQYVDSSYTTEACRKAGITSLKLIDNSCDLTQPYYPLGECSEFCVRGLESK